MPRNCGCSGSSCGCAIQVGAGLALTGTGNANDPYIIELQADSSYVLPGVVTSTYITPAGLPSGVKIDMATAAALAVTLPAPVAAGQEMTYFINRTAASTVTFTGQTYVSMQSTLPTVNKTGYLVATFTALTNPSTGVLYWLASFREQA
jgi:hypothetical protein